MVTATLQEAKAKLHQLVEAAQAGEQVVLMRGSEIIATILPLSADNVQIAPTLTDDQAAHFWGEIDQEPRKVFASPTKAVAALKKRNR